MKIKYLVTLATASLLSLGLVTACQQGPCAGKTTDGPSETSTEKAEPCAGAAKEEPCASKKNP